MNPTTQNQANRNTKPSNTEQRPGQKPNTENTENETSSPYVDLDKANFADRKHGRTNEPLGPSHEPGTV